MAWTAHPQREIVKDLLEHSFEFRKLYEEHERMEQTLKKLDNMKYRSMHEENQRKHIQKLKLWGKDRMYALIKERESHQGRFNA